MRIPVTALTGPLVVAVLAAIQEAIEYAYVVTRTQISEYDPRLQKTLFSQMLYHNISQGAHDACGGLPDVGAELRPNRTKGAYHVAVAVEDVLITVHAVPNRERRPRRTRYTSRYGFNQIHFTINRSGAFEVAPHPDPHLASTAYIQILHGPHAHDRQHLGFTIIAMLDSSDNYLSDTIDLERHVAENWPQYDNVEQIPDLITIPLLDREGAANHEIR